jgi:uncharacterized membrane protein YhaH (DUF805 family)
MMPHIGADGALGGSDVGFGAAIALCFHKYAVFRGRDRRSEYWWWFLFQVLVSVAATILDLKFFATVFGMFSALTTLILLLPTLTVTMRRLHDIDRPGWWILIVVIPIGGMIMLVIMTCRRGTESPNRFGPEFAQPPQTAAA